MQRRQSLFAFVMICAVILASAGLARAQNTATLSGFVTDPQGLAVRGAKVTLSSSTTSAERTALADDSGHFILVGLVPGIYKMRVEGSNFALYENPSVQVRVGEEATVNVRLALGRHGDHGKRAD
jgi:hypothetical protein